MLNPWRIEVPEHMDGFIILDIVNVETGEIRQCRLTVDDVDVICQAQWDAWPSEDEETTDGRES